MSGTWMSSSPPAESDGAGDAPFRRRPRHGNLRGTLSVYTAAPLPFDEPPEAAPDPLTMLQEQLQPGSPPEGPDVAVTRRLVEARAAEVRWARRIAAAGWCIAAALAAVVVGLALAARSTRDTIGRQQARIDSARQHAGSLTRRLVDGEAHVQAVQAQIERTEQQLQTARADRRMGLDEMLATEKDKYAAVAKLQHRLKVGAEARVAAVRAELDLSLAAAPVPTPALSPGSNAPPGGSAPPP